MSHLKEALRMRGDVKIELIGRDGAAFRTIEQKNLIVDLGKELVLRKLGGDADYSAESIIGIVYGSNATAPAPGNSERAVPPWTAEKTVTIEYPSFNQILVSATLGMEEQSGESINELGLVTSTYLFSRIVLNETINKTINFAIRVEWLISIQ